MAARTDAQPPGSALHAAAVSFGYPHGPPVLQDVTLRVPPGETVALMGPNGSGKTTLLRLLARVASPQAGQVHVGDGPVAYVPQNVGLVGSASVLRNVLLGTLGRLPRWRAALGAFPPGDVAAARLLLARLGLAHLEPEPAARLSGGERRRVAIARALLQQPRVLLADEAVANLDPGRAGDLVELVQELRRGGATVVLAVHDAELALRLAERVVVLRAGRVAADERAASLTPDRLEALVRP